MEDQTIIDNEAENKDLHNASEEKQKTKIYAMLQTRKKRRKKKRKLIPRRNFSVG